MKIKKKKFFFFGGGVGAWIRGGRVGGGGSGWMGNGNREVKLG